SGREGGSPLAPRQLDPSAEPGPATPGGGRDGGSPPAPLDASQQRASRQFDVAAQNGWPRPRRPEAAATVARPRRRWTPASGSSSSPARVLRSRSWRMTWARGTRSQRCRTTAASTSRGRT
ncbi:unnamed protein product, partial [Prorocentrum cordatum]